MLIQEVAAVVREWRTHFDECGVLPSEAEKIARAFRNPRDIGLDELIKSSQ